MEKPKVLYMYDPWTLTKAGECWWDGDTEQRRIKGRKNGTTIIA